MKHRKTAGRKGRTLYIKNPTAHRLAMQVSKRRGMTLTDAVIAALEESLEKRGRTPNRDKIDALCAGIKALPVLDSRSPEEILGYDSLGIPR